jgi:uncharacterized protein (UPF0179 family)
MLRGLPASIQKSREMSDCSGCRVNNNYVSLEVGRKLYIEASVLSQAATQECRLLEVLALD